MRTLAHQSGDLEAEVQVLQRDLSLAYHDLEIAMLYRQAGEDDRALSWAEKGVAAFPAHTDTRRNPHGWPGVRLQTPTKLENVLEDKKERARFTRRLKRRIQNEAPRIRRPRSTC